MSESSAAKSDVSPQRITEMAWGFAAPMMLQAALKNRVFDVLESSPKTIDEIAAATGASLRGLRALLGALTGIGILLRRQDRYSLPPDVSAFLVSSKPGFLGGLIQHLTGQLLSHWGDLAKSVQTGKPSTSVNRPEGAEFFSKFVEDLFNMNYAAAKVLADELAKQFPGDRDLQVLDIAAGSGVWGIAMAQRLPGVRVTAVDWPTVTPVTRRVAQRHNVANRLRTIDGDIQDVDFGGGFNIAILGHILHSEGEVRSRKLLKKIHDSLAPGGIVAIAEFVPSDDRSGPPYPLIFAVNMLLHTDVGDTFTFAQMSAWLKEIGFGNIRQIPAPAPSPLLIAVKP